MLVHLLDKDELIGGNALVQAATFLAILLGTVVGGIFILTTYGKGAISTLIIGAAVAGWWTSRFIPSTTPPVPGLKVNVNFLAIAAGNSGLILSNVLLSDSLGGSITPVTENNGQMTATSAVPVPGTLLLLTTAFVLVGIRRKNDSPRA